MPLIVKSRRAHLLGRAEGDRIGAATVAVLSIVTKGGHFDLASLRIFGQNDDNPKAAPTANVRLVPNS